MLCSLQLKLDLFCAEFGERSAVSCAGATATTAVHEPGEGLTDTVIKIEFDSEFRKYQENADLLSSMQELHFRNQVKSNSYSVLLWQIVPQNYITALPW